MPLRVTYIVAQVDKAVAFEWLADLLDRSEFELTFILLNPGPSLLEDELRARRIRVDRVRYRGYRDLLSATIAAMRILRGLRPALETLDLCVSCVGQRRWVTTQLLAQFGESVFDPGGATNCGSSHRVLSATIST